MDIEPTLFGDDFLPEPPIQWPVQLHRCGRSKQLSDIDVWHDFVWKDVIGHDHPAFQNGKRLAALVRDHTPDGLTPHLILTSHTEIENPQITTDDCFVVVVNIHSYLRGAKNDPALGYFAGLLGSGVTSITPQSTVLSASQVTEWLFVNHEGRRKVFEAFVNAERPLDEQDAAILARLLANRGIQTAICSAHGPKLIEELDRLGVDSISKLASLVGVATLRKCVSIWKDNMSNSEEEFWQRTLSDHSILFAQLYSYPVVFICGKPYLGGKGIENSGGKFADFLLMSELTRNAAIIEIKTPCSRLLASQYRDGVFPPSSELTGVLVQSAVSRRDLLHHYKTLVADRVETANDIFFADDPPVLVISGTLTECDVPQKRASFDLFRRSQRDIQIVTFDEMFKKASDLLNLLERGEVAC